jgi:hypothetical protein
MKKVAGKPDRSNRAVVGMSKTVYERARELSAIASQHGWSALGVERTDPPTIGAIFEEAIELLAGRVKKTRAKHEKKGRD